MQAFAAGEDLLDAQPDAFAFRSILPLGLHSRVHVDTEDGASEAAGDDAGRSTEGAGDIEHAPTSREATECGHLFGEVDGSEFGSGVDMGTNIAQGEGHRWRVIDFGHGTQPAGANSIGNAFGLGLVTLLQALNWIERMSALVRRSQPS